MFIMAGVDVSKLSYHTKRALRFCEIYYAASGNELIVISTNEGNHPPGSLYYANMAFDIRFPLSVTGYFFPRLRKLLGRSFDLVLEGNHARVAYDPVAGYYSNA